MAAGGPSTSHAGAGGPKPMPAAAGHSERQEQRRDLASWWKNFKRSDKKVSEQQAPHGIFGVPLQQSIRYANVAISLFNDEGQSYIYGYVPIVVAKCGVYLKEKATDVEGIFRLAGSEKRIKELKAAFDSPDRYGKGLDWTGYTVHDAANILRRYFNQLPEPIIPLEFYERFRHPIRNHQAQAVGSIEAQSPSVGDFDHEAAIKAYQALITELPPLNRQLLLYILDLLAVFASKSDLNKMTTPNLAAIFQPGILSHPQHDMAPQEYRLSQDVLIFLIENQDSFLIGMHGTAADPETVREVQSGTSAKPPSTPTTPTRAKTVVARSGSNASAAAESVRKFGSIRRNVSVSSKHSKRSEGGPIPVTPALPSPGTPTSGVHRSNTVPSRRGGSAQHSPRFSRDKGSDPPTPSPGATIVPTSDSRRESVQRTPIASDAPAFPGIAEPSVISASSSEVTTPMAGTIASDTSSAVRSDYVTPKKDTTPLLAPPRASTEQQSDRASSNTPSTSSSRGFLGILKQSPTSDGEQRKPNKLQKKRIPGSALSSAQSSSHSLPDQEGHPKSPVTPSFTPATTELQGERGERSAYATAQTTPVQPTPHRSPTDATLRPTVSPSHSAHSTDFSDADLVGDDMPPNASEQPEREKRRRWHRFSRSQSKMEQPQTPSSSGNPLGTMSPRDQTTSRSTFGSSAGGQPRRSFQEPTPLAPSATDPAAGMPVSQQREMPPPQVQSSNTDPVFSDSERERKGPMSWIRNKLQDRRDRDAEKRAKTPERNRDRSESKQDLRMPAEAIPVRGKSLEQQWAAPTSAPAQAAPSTKPVAVAEPAAAAAQQQSPPSRPAPGAEMQQQVPPMQASGNEAARQLLPSAFGTSAPASGIVQVGSAEEAAAAAHEDERPVTARMSAADEQGEPASVEQQLEQQR